MFVFDSLIWHNVSMETALCSVIYVFVNVGYSVLDISVILCDEHDAVIKIETAGFPFNPNLINSELLSTVLSDTLLSIKNSVTGINISDEVQIIKYINKNKYIIDLGELRKNNWNIIDGRYNKSYQSISDGIEGNVCFINMDFDCWNLICMRGGKKKIEVSLDFDSVDEFVRKVDLQKLLAFLTVPITAIELEELLAVLYTEQAFNATSRKVQDVIRGLVMQFIRQNSGLEDFFVSSKDCKVYVSGGMLSILPFEELLLSIIDGIGCGVPLDINFQNNRLPFDFLKRVFRKREISETLKIAFNFHSIKYIPLRYDRFKRSGTALVGTIKNEKAKEQFFLITDEMRVITASGKSEIFVDLEEGTSIQTIKARKNNFVLEDGEQILFDGRLSPIVYGDSYQNNHVQIINWIEQLR